MSRLVGTPLLSLALLAALACACGNGAETAPAPDAGVIISGEFTTTPGTFAVAGEDYMYFAQAWQDRNLTPTYALVDPPAGMSIHPDSGDVGWVPKASQGGPHDITIVATTDTTTTEQSYVLEVAVPTLVVQGEIGPEGEHLMRLLMSCVWSSPPTL